MKRWIYLALAMGGVSAMPAWGQGVDALGTPKPRPMAPRAVASTNSMTINSDFMEADMVGQKLIFKGNVTVQDTGFKMTADDMTVFLKADGQGADRILSKGNVKIVQPGRTTSAGECEFIVDSKKVTLTGTPRPTVISAEGNQQEGSKIIFYLDQEKIEVEGGSRLILPGGFPSLGSGTEKGAAKER